MNVILYYGFRTFIEILTTICFIANLRSAWFDSSLEISYQLNGTSLRYVTLVC